MFEKLFKNPWVPLLILFVMALLRLIALDAYPLMDSTEARYANIGRWMVATGDYITPMYPEGVPFWGKPPLSFWYTALSFKALGLSEFAARLPSFISSMLTILLTFIAARKIFSREVAYLSAIVLMSSGLFYVLSGAVMTDPALTFTITLSIVSFIMAMESKTKRERLIWGYLVFIGGGMSLMTKGPVGIIFISAPIFAWAICTRRITESWRTLPWITGTILLLLIAVPWHIIAEEKTPGFLEYYLVGEHWKRFMEPGWSGDKYGNAHKTLKGMSWVFILVASLPWSPFAIRALYGLRLAGGRLRDLLGHKWALFFIFWAFASIVFFTISSNVVITYILPGVPALAVLMAWAIISFERVAVEKGIAGVSRSLPFIFRRGPVFATMAFVPVVFFIAAFAVFPSIGERRSHKATNAYFLEQKTSTEDHLAYVGLVSFSADFYSRGQAEFVPLRNKERLLELATAPSRTYFVIKTQHVEHLNKRTDNRLKVRATFGKHSMLTPSDPSEPESH